MSLPDLPFDPSCCLIGGEWHSSASLEKLELINPSDGNILTEIASGNGMTLMLHLPMRNIHSSSAGVQHLQLSVGEFCITWEG